jgi:hypothetical protein
MLFLSEAIFCIVFERWILPTDVVFTMTMIGIFSGKNFILSNHYTDSTA